MGRADSMKKIMIEVGKFYQSQDGELVLVVDICQHYSSYHHSSQTSSKDGKIVVSYATDFDGYGAMPWGTKQSNVEDFIEEFSAVHYDQLPEEIQTYDWVNQNEHAGW